MGRGNQGPARRPAAHLSSHEIGNQSPRQRARGVSFLRPDHRRHPGSARMSETTFATFDDYLEKTLASLPMCASRREATRDELLAHLFCVFEDEFARCGDEAKAAAQTLRRFGAADELQTDLDASVPVRERIISWLLLNKGKIMWRLFLVFGVVLVLVGMGLVMPAVQQMLFQEVLMLSVVLLGVGFAICAGGVWSFVHGVRRFRARTL